MDLKAALNRRIEIADRLQEIEDERVVLQHEDIPLRKEVERASLEQFTKAVSE
jgi:hypothetical protein